MDLHTNCTNCCLHKLGLRDFINNYLLILILIIYINEYLRIYNNKFLIFNRYFLFFVQWPFNYKWF